MTSEFAFRRVAILGTGLIGGSFALALRQHFPQTRIMGFDREAPLRAALERRAIDDSSNDLSSAVSGADLVFIALPISATIELLPEISHHAAAHALVTDVCSTKRTVCRVAAQHFKQAGAVFLGGHPMAGRETSGIEAADARLFADSPYILVSESEQPVSDERVPAFIELIRKFGARDSWLDAETHDWAVGIISHLPQMAAIALANVIAEEDDDPAILPALAGPGAQDALRLAGSPYAMWRDIAMTNSDNISRALDRLEQAIEHLRAQLTSRELEKLFAAANLLQKSL